MAKTGNQITHGMLHSMINNHEINSLMKKQLPASTSMQLAKTIRKCSDELREYSEKRQEIVQKYSKKDKDGNPLVQPGDMVTLDPDTAEEATEKLREISNVVVGDDFKLPTFKFNSDVFPDISPQEAMAILPFVKDE